MVQTEQGIKVADVFCFSGSHPKLGIALFRLMERRPLYIIQETDADVVRDNTFHVVIILSFC
jgi:hypothetical protein